MISTIPKSVLVYDREYRILESPELLRGDDGRTYDTQVDHVDRVIWCAPNAGVLDLLGALPLAVALAWQERCAAALGSSKPVRFLSPRRRIHRRRRGVR